MGFLLGKGMSEGQRIECPAGAQLLCSGQHLICGNLCSGYTKRTDNLSAEFCFFEAVYPWPSVCFFFKGRRILRYSQNLLRFYYIYFALHYNPEPINLNPEPPFLPMI